MEFNCKCGACSIYMKKKGANMVGAYCMDCGAWVKWVGKKDQTNLERQGFIVHKEDYISPTVKLRQEEIARDKELLAKANESNAKIIEPNGTASTSSSNDEDITEINLKCKKCGELTSNDIYTKKTNSTHLGVHCKSCNSWIKWVGKKDIEVFKKLGVEELSDSVECVSDASKDSKNTDKPSTSSLIESSENIKKGLHPNSSHDVIEEYNDYDDEDDEYDDYCDDEDDEYDEYEYYDEDNVVDNADLKDEGGCSFCSSGVEMQSLGDSNVELTYFSGVLSISDKDNDNLLGSYKLAYCPSCGRKLF